MQNVWVELKYGVCGQEIPLCKLDDQYLLSIFKERALSKAEEFVNESRGVDSVIHTQDKLELAKLRVLLGMLIPPSWNPM